MEPNTPARRASVTGLAIIGFIALVVLGLWLALYIARSLTGEGGLGAVGDYVGSVFTDSSSSTLAVVPGDNASTTISFSQATSTYSQGGYTPPPATTTTAKPPAKPSTYAQGTYYQTVTTTYPVPGATRIEVAGANTPTTYYGSPDLTVSITDVGYIDSNGTFVATSSMPVNSKLAAKFLVSNAGTNKTGPWEIKVTVATTIDSEFFKYATMTSLDPYQSTIVTMTLDIGHPRTGTHEVTVKVDPDNKLAEGNESNNTTSHNVTAY